MYIFCGVESHVIDRRDKGAVPCSMLILRQKGAPGVHMNGVLPWLVRWAQRAPYKRFLSCLVCSGRHSTKYILCPFAVYYLRYAVTSFFTIYRISLVGGKRAGQKVHRKIAVAVQNVKPLYFLSRSFEIRETNCKHLFLR
jgi:hypothetical protein